MLVNSPGREDTHKKDLTSVAFFPFVGPTSNCISRILTRHSIKTVGLMSRNVASFLQHIKNDLNLKTPSVLQHPL